jgi:ATP-dependent protease ClpP protease subunit
MKTSIRKPTFRAALQSDGTLELLVYEDIGENWWSGGGVTAKTVKQQLDQAGPYSRLAVRINSPGGDAFEGIAIHNLLRAQGKPIDVFVDGIAASAASVIAMAGDTRTMGTGAMMMIHNAWTVCQGYADDMRKMADVLDGVSGAVAETYIKRAGLSEKDAHALMDAESWLSAEDCVANGLATAVAEDDENDDAAMALARSFKSLARLKKLPEKLRADADGGDPCQCYCAPCQDDRCNECECRGCDAENCEANSCNCAGAAENKSEKDTKRVDGEDLPKSAFAYRPTDDHSDWKLPIKFSTDEKTKTHIRNAIARWKSTDMPDADEKDKARSRIKAAAKEHDIDIDEGSLDRADLSAVEAELQLIETNGR